MNRNIKISSVNPPLLIFTDLDGTLLDHADYSFDPIKPLLPKLKALGIPVIPTTSKTIAEIKSLGVDFGNVPMIGENGMVIDEGRGLKDIPGHSYAHIRKTLETLPKDLRKNIQGFGDMSLEDVIACTDQPREAAQNAKNRDASEPFLWHGNDQDLKAALNALHDAGLNTTQGGRFYHIMSDGGKDTALERLWKKYGKNIPTVALGDGPNDAGMLSVATYGVRIPNAHGKNFDIPNPCGEIIDAPSEGPKGWAFAINSILDARGINV